MATTVVLTNIIKQVSGSVLVNFADGSQLEFETLPKLKEYEKVELVFKIQDETYKQALIIDFFDTLEIFINPYPCSDGLWDYEITKEGKYLSDGLAFKDRFESTTKAIEKLNEIYNSL